MTNGTSELTINQCGTSYLTSERSLEQQKVNQPEVLYQLPKLPTFEKFATQAKNSFIFGHSRFRLLISGILCQSIGNWRSAAYGLRVIFAIPYKL